MQPQAIQYSDRRDIPVEKIVSLYRANGWSSAEKPQQDEADGFGRIKLCAHGTTEQRCRKQANQRNQVFAHVFDHSRHCGALLSRFSGGNHGLPLEAVRHMARILVAKTIHYAHTAVFKLVVG
jgi:hypothetical protein